MANVIISPNMNLPVPIVGLDAGPQYATDVNSCLTLVDQHNHTTGSGVAITPAAININSSLTMNGFSLIGIKSLTLSAQSSDPGIFNIYSKGVDLYYEDGSGNVIRITQSGSITGAAGTITGLPSGTASASFAAGTFVFQAATLTPANIDGGSFILRNNTASSFGLTLSPPSALGSNYSLVLPAIPASVGIVTLDTSGNLGAVTSNINLPGKAVTENGSNVVVSSTNATNSLAIIRAAFDGIPSLIYGEGATAVNNSTGNYTVTFSSGFSDTPIITISPINTGGATYVAVIFNQSASACTIQVTNLAGAPFNTGFNIIAIGQRA